MIIYDTLTSINYNLIHKISTAYNFSNKPSAFIRYSNMEWALTTKSSMKNLIFLYKHV
jgi:hypothetical protein